MTAQKPLQSIYCLALFIYSVETYLKAILKS